MWWHRPANGRRRIMRLKSLWPVVHPRLVSLFPFLFGGHRQRSRLEENQGGASAQEDTSKTGDKEPPAIRPSESPASRQEPPTDDPQTPPAPSTGNSRHSILRTDTHSPIQNQDTARKLGFSRRLLSPSEEPIWPESLGATSVPLAVLADRPSSISWANSLYSPTRSWISNSFLVGFLMEK